MNDIIFLAREIQYRAERNRFKKLQSRFPFARYVVADNLVDAHLAASRESMTEFFYVVDYNYEIAEDFDLSYVTCDADKAWVTRFKNSNDTNLNGVRLLHKSVLERSIEDASVDFMHNFGTLGIKDVDIIAAIEVSIAPDIVVLARDTRNWSNLDHYARIKSMYPNAKYVENDDIVDLHFNAAKAVDTAFFYTIDVGFDVDSSLNDYLPIAADAQWVTRFENDDGEFNIGLRMFHQSAFDQVITDKATHDFINDFGVVGIKDVSGVGCYKEQINPDIIMLTHHYDGWKDNLNHLRKKHQVKLIEGDDVIELHQKAAALSETSFFYVLDAEYLPTAGFDFSYLPEPEFIDWVTRFKANDQYLHGLRLMHKSVADQEITETIDFINDFGTYGIKDVDIDAVDKKKILLDIIFIDIGESFADNHFELLKMQYPNRVKRVSNVNGLWDAHTEAARISDTQMFFVVDADSVASPSFNFSLRPNVWDQNFVYVWQSYCALTALTYGNAGIKLLNKDFFKSKPDNYVDMTTTVGHQIADGIKIIEEVASYNRFYEDEYLAWRGAFRECAKLKSGVISGSDAKENEERLSAWLAVETFPHRNTCAVSRGAKEGMLYAESGQDISKLNDYNYLKEIYVKSNNT